MGRRKRKKVVLRQVRIIGKIFKCPGCGHKTIKVDMKHRKKLKHIQGEDGEEDTRVPVGNVMVKCAHCGVQQEVKYNEIMEPVDAFGDFIDIWYREQEYERLTKREEKLLEKQQYSELASIYTILADIAKINAEKFMEEYNKDKSPEDQKAAVSWRETEDKYNKSAHEIREKLASGEIKDNQLDTVYEDTETQTFATDGNSQPLPSTKPKKKVSLEEMLDDTGFLEF